MLGLVVVIAIGLLLPAGASAQTSTRCFPETGQCISGAIRMYWERNGGLPVFGYPTAPQQVETIEGTWTGPVQWFERDRLEDHSNEGIGVLAGRLGAQRLEQLRRPWQPRQPVAQQAGCEVFAVTTYQVCEPFLSYWRRNGGLARFGYPLTPLLTEQIEGQFYKVQYFERRRMEYHPEKAGTAYEVLLGLLGNEIRTRGMCEAQVLPELQADFLRLSGGYMFGCAIPGAAWGGLSGVSQRFQGGQMFYLPLPSTVGSWPEIAVLRFRKLETSYDGYQDRWSEGQPVSGGETPPPGLYEPVRGFGKVWREEQGVRDALGWAVEPEAPVPILLQQFENGWLMKAQGGTAWLLFNDGKAYSGLPVYYY
jgi:hypothetical protein